LHRSKSFKVTDFGTNRKLIYDFLLVIMAALRSRCGHIFALWFLSFYLFFIPRLISAAADWMSTIHMV